jgi:spore photoproduct lyase
MSYFVPQLVYVDKKALEYRLGRELRKRLEDRGIEVVLYEDRIPAVYRKTFREGFLAAKKVMVVSVWRQREFQTCRPSAHYQLPLVSGCPGHCEYCYLNTNLGRRPYVRVYVNVDDVLHRAREYVRGREPEKTVFEGAATSDPIVVEYWTGSLRRAVEYFAALEGAGFRFVTKFTNVDGLLAIDHRGKTEIRFSINSPKIITEYEKGVPRLKSRLEAAGKCARAGYPLGFLIAPIFAFEGWRDQYGRMLRQVREHMPEKIPVFFELITHRFTARSKKIIRDAYPESGVPLEETDRSFKYGQFGYGKYVYPGEVMEELKEFFVTEIKALFPEAKILYFV